MWIQADGDRDEYYRLVKEDADRYAPAAGLFSLAVGTPLLLEAVPSSVLASSAVGAGSSGTANYVSQSTNKEEVDWGEVTIATATGAAAGAVTPALGVTTKGAMGIGSVANTSQYAATQVYYDEKITPVGLGMNAIIGSAGGKLAGTYSRTGLRYGDNIPGASSLNSSLDLMENITIGNTSRNIGSGILMNSTPYYLNQSSTDTEK